MSMLSARFAAQVARQLPRTASQVSDPGLGARNSEIFLRFF